MYKNISASALQTGLKVIEKSFGGQFAKVGLKDSEYKAISTGHDDLDFALTRGQGGIFLGGLCEIAGIEGAGKTSLAMRVVGMAQKLGLHCAWFDAEHSFSPDLAELNQCDTGKLIQLQMVVGEGDKARLLNASEVLHRVFEAVWSNIFSIIVVDSVAALIPERVASVDFEAGSKGMGELARDLAQQLPKISAACANRECTVIFINQIREKIGVIYGDPKITPGGRALKHLVSQRIFVSKKFGDAGLVKQKDEDGIEQIIGHYAKVQIKKNRRNKPCYDNLEIPIYYEEYFPDIAKKCYDLARKLQVIKPRKSILTWKDGDAVVAQVEGESEMLSHIRTDELESYLAYCCVSAAQGERNLKLKVPVNVSPTLSEIAAKYDSKKIKPKKAKKDTKPTLDSEIDLDE